jgi:hypothetical protein
MDCTPFIAGGEGSEVLEMIEAVLDAVALRAEGASCGMATLRDGLITLPLAR